MSRSTAGGRTAAPPVSAGPLLADLHAELVSLLRSLDREDWGLPTSAGRWRVGDVAAHLLDLDIRRLGAGRDGHPPPAPEGPLVDDAALVAYLDGLNAEWVTAARRISRPLLVDFIEVAGSQAVRHLDSLDPFAPALYPVAWAGEERSESWLDVGREYVERWHHQDQIREAVSAPALDGSRWLEPLLEVSLRCLPYAYREVEADPGTALRLRLGGEGGGVWMLFRGSEGWTLGSSGGPARRGSGLPAEDGPVACDVEVEARRAARLLLRGRGGDLRDLDEAFQAAGMRVCGDSRLAVALLDARALMV